MDRGIVALQSAGGKITQIALNKANQARAEPVEALDTASKQKIER